MTHPHEDLLLLHAYGELPEPQAADLQEHLVSCGACRDRFRDLAESREAVAWGLKRRSRVARRRVLWAALPLAAAIGGVLLWRGGERPDAPPRPAWQTHLIASPEAGYVTGTTFITIDSQLVRLEQRRGYGSLD